jgi:hypothetical protein
LTGLTQGRPVGVSSHGGDERRSEEWIKAMFPELDRSRLLLFSEGGKGTLESHQFRPIAILKEDSLVKQKNSICIA